MRWQIRSAWRLVLLGMVPFPLSAQPDTPMGDGVIRAPAGDSEIVITTTARLAGAIHSLRWRGREFIDSADHGRQLQSAINLDCGGALLAETFNPTEAGSRRDGVGPICSSRRLHYVAKGSRLQTTTQMAFWLAPGESSGGHPARNTAVLSDHLLTKRVQIGYEDLPHVIQYDVTFSVPVGERHTRAVFEAVTGYMPAEFERFWKFNASSGKLEPLSDGPGEQADPVVLATADGRHGMGVFSPERRRGEGWTGPTYGRWRFDAEGVVKWNCVYRLADRAHGVAPGDYTFRNFVMVGDVATVEASLRALHARFARP
jgi:hypothetical protein